MRVPSRHRELFAGEKWQAAFGRKEAIEKIVSYVCSHWARLQKYPTGDIVFSQSEPKITKYFCQSLRAHALSHGITGIFIPEHPVAKLDELNKTLGNRGRTDITYFSDRQSPALEIVFEFKKLKLSSRGKISRSQYCDAGMIRFVNGIYTPNDEIGFMVGLVENETDSASISASLQRMLQHPDTRSLLRMVSDNKGKVVTSPALRFMRCHFETHHARDHVEECPDILLGHLILSHGC
ncbi:MAG: hypothetical protein GC149_03140 [Gammaproteobacteria bacterium]|nr:hypothetical protein [Gammaproteobacteria bacterium]